jgi:hypothetical protein
MAGFLGYESWPRRNSKQWEGKRMEIEVKFIQGAISLAILVFLILCIVIRPFREWLFGPPEIDDSKGGFPWSRRKHR